MTGRPSTPCSPRTTSSAPGSGRTALDGDIPPTWRVARVSGPTALLDDASTRIEATVPPRLVTRPVVGDLVDIRTAQDGSLTITRVRPRTTELARSGDRRGNPRPVAANARWLVVVAAVTDPPPRPRLIDRYLVAGHVGGLDCALVLTKRDLPHDGAAADAMANRYREIGYPVFMGAATDGALLDGITALIGDDLAVLAGHSGVGKSTLTRGLTGVARETGAVSEKSRTGRHTTSDPMLLPLISGRGGVIDTAGVRTFHLPKLGAGELAAAFPEIATAAAYCHFRGCAHVGEPGCAVPGRVSSHRLDSYRRLRAASE